MSDSRFRSTDEIISRSSILQLMQVWLEARQNNWPEAERRAQEELMHKHGIWISRMIDPSLTPEELEGRLWNQP